MATKTADAWGVEVLLGTHGRASHDCTGKAAAEAECLYWQSKGYQAQVLKNGRPLAARPDLADTKPLPKPAA
jgi:glycine/serine hydroxymethyltransferase